MRVRTKVSILGWGTALIFLFLLVSLILAMLDKGIFAGMDPDIGAKMLIGSLGIFAILTSIMIWEFKIPKEKYSLRGEAKDVKTRTSGPARVMIFNIEDSVVAFGAPTPLFNPPDISGREVEVYGDRIKTDKLPDLIFWTVDKHLKSLAHEIFFATRIKNISTSEEYEAPLFLPMFQIVLWMLITASPFFLLPSSVLLGLREIIHVGVQWILIPVFGVIGLIITIILPNWIISSS
jgi:hypothetical protein